MTNHNHKETELSAKEIAEYLCISERQVHRLAKVGLPFGNGKGNLFDCVTWYMRNKSESELTIAKTKKVKAEVKKLDIEIKERKKSLVTIKDVQSFTHSTLGALRNELSSVGSAVAPEVVGVDNVGVIRMKIETKINQAINRCAEKFKNQHGK